MAKIWKFNYTLGDSGVIVPEGTEILTMRFQQSSWGVGFMVWGRVPEPVPDERVLVRINIVPTGDFADPDWKYLNTIEMPKSGEIIHIFVE